MKTTRFLKRYGLDVVTLLAAIIVFYFGLVTEGKEMAKALLADSPVLFYSIFVPIASIFAAWVITRIKKVTK